MGEPWEPALPFELVEATEHHGPYIVNNYWSDVCDFYAMSNPAAASLRNGGTSYPVLFTGAVKNAAFVHRACNSHHALVRAILALRQFMPPCSDERVNAALELADAALALARGEPRAIANARSQPVEG